jgi:hypothetical protein
MNNNLSMSSKKFIFLNTTICYNDVNQYSDLALILNIFFYKEVLHREKSQRKIFDFLEFLMYYLNISQEPKFHLKKERRAMQEKQISPFVVMALMLFPSMVTAEDMPREMGRLETVVVSATRNEIPVFDASQSVTVITEEEIMDSPFERIEDAGFK